MSRGKRYNGGEQKLNIKKVVAVIIAFLTIIMIAIIFAKLLKKDDKYIEKQVPITYYSAYENNKWGIINSHGEIVIVPQYEEMVVVPNRERPVFIVNYDVDYNKETYKSKAINDKNEQLFTEYEQIEFLQNQDKQNIVWLEEDCLKVKKDNKFGLINLSGKVLLECKYDNIYPIMGIENSLITELNGKKGLVSATGSIIIENNYSEITTITNKYEDGYIVKNSEEKYGVIGRNKKIALEEKYDEIKKVYLNNTYIAKESNVWKVINTKENMVYDLKDDDVISIIDTNKMIIKKNDKYGIKTISGEEKLPPIYDELRNIYLNFYIAKKDNMYGVIDEANNIKIDFKYKNLSYIKEANVILGESDKVETDLFDRNFNLQLSGILSEMNINKGYMKIRIDSNYKYYNFKFEDKTNRDILTSNTLFIAKKDGKYGYVNRDNIEVINYLYDDATEQNEAGYVAVKKDGKWGAINSKGETVVEPSLELENCPIIDFIGEWHLAEDINANYYTK